MLYDQLPGGQPSFSPRRHEDPVVRHSYSHILGGQAMPMQNQTEDLITKLAKAMKDQF